MMLLFKKIIFLILLLSLFNSCERDTGVSPEDPNSLPEIPAGLRVFAARDGEVGIEWTGSSNPNHIYIIYRSILEQENYTKIDSTFDQYYVDDSLSYDIRYYYKVSTKDQFNRESELTNAVSAQPVNIQPPLLPLSFDINARNWNGSVYFYLNWYSSRSTDVLGYEIYRSTVDDFTPDSTTLIGFTNNLFYIDAKEIELLTEYFYKLKAVDKGGLKSSASNSISDYVLNSPELIFPANNAETNFFPNVQIKTASKPANYKLVFQSNEFFGTVYEINFYSEKVNEIISVEVPSTVIFAPYKKYYWRALTYSVNSEDPNSFTELNSFTITTQ